MRRLKTVRRPPIYPKTPGHLPCSSLTHPLPLSSRRPSVSFGGFGLSMDVLCSPLTTIFAGAAGLCLMALVLHLVVDGSLGGAVIWTVGAVVFLCASNACKGKKG